MVLRVDHTLLLVLVLVPRSNFQMAATITPTLYIRKLRPERFSKFPVVTRHQCWDLTPHWEPAKPRSLWHSSTSYKCVTCNQCEWHWDKKAREIFRAKSCSGAT